METQVTLQTFEAIVIGGAALILFDTVRRCTRDVCAESIGLVGPVVAVDTTVVTVHGCDGG